MMMKVKMNKYQEMKKNNKKNKFQKNYNKHLQLI